MAADIREAVRLLEEARASGADERDLALPDGRQVRFRRAPAPELAYSLTVQAAGGQEELLFAQFHAAAARPSGYPVEAPFLPEQPVGVFAPRVGSRVLTWETAADPGPLLTAVLAESEQEGWQLQSAPAAGAKPPVVPFVLRRGERQRIVSFASGRAGSVLTLLEAPRAGGQDLQSGGASGGPIGTSQTST